MLWHAKEGSIDDTVGLIPTFLMEDDPRPAREQIDDRYIGGWRATPSFSLRDDFALLYEGDPPLEPVAYTQLRLELIIVYPFAWVAIVQLDGTFEVSRCD